jgi:hypothetical protein
MTRSVMLAALLSSALVVGCADQTPRDSAGFDETEATAPLAGNGSDGEPVAQAPSPGQDSPAAQPPAARTPAAPARPQAAAPSAPSTPQPRFQEVTLPAGTALPLELLTALSSETSAVETPVRARLRQAVMVDDAVVLPAGTVLTGTVLEAQRAGRVQGRARLAFRFDTVEREDARERLATNPITFEAEGTVGEDAAKVGAGAVGGAVIGSILGGGSGAARGAAIGGAAGAGVVLATRGDEVELAQGMSIAATLAQPFQARVRVQ